MYTSGSVGSGEAATHDTHARVLQSAGVPMGITVALSSPYQPPFAIPG